MAKVACFVRDASAGELTFLLEREDLDELDALVTLHHVQHPTRSREDLQKECLESFARGIAHSLRLARVARQNGKTP